MDNSNNTNSSNYLSRAIEITIRLGVLAFIFGWCFEIVAPFLSPVLWGLIIAVTVYPLFNSIKKKLGGRGTLTATLLTLTFLCLLLIPTFFLGDSLFDGIQKLKSLYQSGHLIPPPDESIKSWPAIAKPVADLWILASNNLQDAMMKYEPQVKKAASLVFSFLTGTGLGILQFLLSIIIAGVFLNYAQAGGNTIHKIFIRLAGNKGEHFAHLSEITIRNVVKGILGVAIIQTLMAGLGFFIAGVPAAGLWTLFCLILAIVQIGVGPVALGVVIYMFATADILTASLLAAWTLVVMLSDNILKPILLGRGAPVPMLVVFLGSVGGFIASGFIGLFLGPVILSLGYKLFLSWLEEARG
jgi:predicted PurR-regulated permease PerM